MVGTAETATKRLQRLRDELRYWQDQLGVATKEVVLGAGAPQQERLKTYADRVEALEREIDAFEQLLRGH